MEEIVSRGTNFDGKLKNEGSMRDVRESNTHQKGGSIVHYVLFYKFKRN